MGLRTSHLGLIATPGISQALGQFGALGLQVEGLVGNRQFFVGRAHLGIGAHHIGHQGDAGDIRRGLGGIGAGLGAFDAALQGAEEVELIGRGNPDATDIAYRDFVRQQEGLARLL